MSFIIDDKILFSAVEWGIKDLVDKLTCDRVKAVDWFISVVITFSTCFVFIFKGI